MKRTNPENKRTAIIRIRTTQAEYIDITDGADISDLSLSEFCRRRIFDRRITAHTDIKTISELRRIGGLLKKIFSEGNGNDDTKSILAETKKAIQRIANLTTAEV